MRFLVDENLSPRICTLLGASGHDAEHVRELGLAGASDHDVLVAAADGDRVVVTADTGDFGRELAATGATRPSVILLRQLPDVVRAADVAALLVANLGPELVAALDRGAFAVLTPRSVRLRPLPMR